MYVDNRKAVHCFACADFSNKGITKNRNMQWVVVLPLRRLMLRGVCEPRMSELFLFLFLLYQLFKFFG